MSDRWEVGSEFHWDSGYLLGKDTETSEVFPANSLLLATGRVAFASLAHSLGEPRRKLHVPSYFCPEVLQALWDDFDLVSFRDVPTEATPDLDSIEASSGDVVLAVNFFGHRDQAPWSEWKRQNQDIVLVEDHSHDPFSVWARNSTADYAMASLRKTLPLPDGAILWSPNSAPLGKDPTSESIGAAVKLMAMVEKAAYLEGRDVNKDEYRELQVRGEHLLSVSRIERASSFTRSMSVKLDIERLLSQRVVNLRHLLPQLNGQSIQPLFTTWSQGQTPYNAVLLCDDVAHRDALRSHLIASNVFPAVHWSRGEVDVHFGVAETRISQRIVTIPIDFRYSTDDIDRVAEIIRCFSNNRVPVL